MITSAGLEKLGFDPINDFVLQDDGAGTYIKEWKSGSPQPTEAEIETAHTEWQAEYDSQEYARNRASAYAPIADQLDMQYWDSVNDTTTWKDHVASIKNKFPKV